jgi:hypothetical protein
MLQSSIFFGVPVLPASFVPRPEANEPLLDQLLIQRDIGSETPQLIAIHGPDGLGKTTLAAALALEPGLRRVLPDGVLWITLGPQPSLLPLLVGWIEALRRQGWGHATHLTERFVQPTSVRLASAHLHGLLADRALLLVLDDVWTVEQVQPFPVGGPRCRTLLTTRQTTRVESLEALRYELAVLRPTQAQSLLERRLGRELIGSEREHALAVAQAVGYLPLALELAAARVSVAHPVSWSELQAALVHEMAQEEKAADPHDHDTGLSRLNATCNLSLRSLREEDEDTWRAFCLLGMLPAGAVLTSPMAVTLWEVATDTAGALLERLRNYGLLQRGPDLSSSAGSELTYCIHYLLHDLARRLLEAPKTPTSSSASPGLGIPLPVARARLLSRYHRQASDGRWHSVPDDGHIHAFLVWYLEQAGAMNEIDALLREETADGRLGWYQARERLGQTAAYLLDVARAWELADTAGAALIAAKGKRAGKLGWIVGQQVRYGLIATSIGSLVHALPPAILESLVRQGQLTSAQGLFYAQSIGRDDVCAKILAAAASSLEASERRPLLKQALTVALAISNPPYRAEVLRDLAPDLEAEERQAALQAALASVPTIDDGTRRARMLVSLVPSLGVEARQTVLREALAGALALGDGETRAWALIRLSPVLEVGERRVALQEALAAARAIVGVRERTLALEELASLLPVDMLPEALAAAEALEEEWARTRALGTLAPHLPAELLPVVLDAVRAIEDGEKRAQALISLAPWLGAEDRLTVLREALAVTGADSDGLEWTRARILTAMAPLLEVDECRRAYQEALTAAQAIRYGGRRVETLLDLALQLDVESRRDVLRAALVAIPSIYDYDYGSAGARADALSALVPHLPLELLPHALAAARAIRGTGARAEALGALAPYLPPELLRKALAAARALRHAQPRSKALLTLAPLLDAKERRTVLRQALVATRAIENGRERARMLETLAPLLNAEERRAIAREALDAYQAIGDGKEQVLALGALAPLLGPEERRSAMRAALAVTRVIGDRMIERQRTISVGSVGYESREEARAEALSALAPYLTAELFPEALTAVRAFDTGKTRAKALSALAPYLPAELLPKALVAARTIRYKAAQVVALGALAPRLGSEEREVVVRDALVAAWNIRDLEARASALAVLAPYMPAAMLSKVPNRIRAIAYGKARDAGLAALMLQLPAESLAEALVAARAIIKEDMRARALAALTPRLSVELIPETLAVVRAIEGTWERVWALSALAPHLGVEERRELLREALAAARTIDDAENRTRAMGVLAPLLEGEERRIVLQEALAAAQAMNDAWRRAETLGASVPLFGVSECHRILQEAIGSIKTIEYFNVSARAEALGGLVAQLEQLSVENLYPLWCQLLHALVGQKREDFLADLSTLTPLLRSLGGSTAAAEVVQAISDVGRWFP